MSETPTAAPPLPPAPPPQLGFFGTVWPEPPKQRGRGVPLAVLLGALGFAVFVPLTRVGIGWVLGGAVVTTCVAVVARRSTGIVSTSDRIARAAWGLSAVALLSVLAFRNAWWLVTFCVLAAFGCAILAVGGGRSIRSIAVTVILAPLAVLRSLPWVASHTSAATTAAATTVSGGTASGAGEAAAPAGAIVADAPASSAPGVTVEPQAPKVGRLVWSIVVTALLLLIFGALFASADAAFAKLLANATSRIDGGIVFRWIFLFVVGAAVTAGATFLVCAPPDLSSMEKPGKARLRRTEWMLPIAALVVLFGGFVAVQVTVLFGGSEHVLRTAGLTYAEYARSGFWQLTTATILTLLVVAGTVRWAPRATTGDRVLLRVLLGTLSTLTLVIVASALNRMYTYQEAYSFTGERIFVMAFELLLGCTFLMVIGAGMTKSGAWLPRAMAAGVVVMLLSLAVFNPELYAAQRNVQRYEATKKIDLWYLRALSADATPALVTLPEDLRKCALMWISAKLKDGDPWNGWNLGREQARAALDGLGPNAGGSCSNARIYDYTNTR